MLIVSGIVRISRYPLAAQTRASAIPVLPDVGSTMTLRPGWMRPSASAAAIIDMPMRSLTLPPGFIDSSLPRIVAPDPAAIRLSRTRGVRPTTSMIESAIGIRGPYHRSRARRSDDHVPGLDAPGRDHAARDIGVAGGEGLRGGSVAEDDEGLAGRVADGPGHHQAPGLALGAQHREVALPVRRPPLEDVRRVLVAQG